MVLFSAKEELIMKIITLDGLVISKEMADFIFVHIFDSQFHSIPPPREIFSLLEPLTINGYFIKTIKDTHPDYQLSWKGHWAAFLYRKGLL